MKKTNYLVDDLPPVESKFSKFVRVYRYYAFFFFVYILMYLKTVTRAPILDTFLFVIIMFAIFIALIMASKDSISIQSIGAFVFKVFVALGVGYLFGKGYFWVTKLDSSSTQDLYISFPTISMAFAITFLIVMKVYSTLRNYKLHWLP